MANKELQKSRKRALISGSIVISILLIMVFIILRTISVPQDQILALFITSLALMMAMVVYGIIQKRRQ